MPTNYTPNAGNNPSTITLPSDLDAATAESVNAALRALGDKSAFAIATRAAIAAVNTFTRGQIIEPPDEREALIESTRYPTDITADNRWALLFKFNCEHNRTLRFYVGGLQGVGRLAITLNAHWSVTDQQWEIEDDGGEGAALIWRDNSLSLFNVSASAFPFLNWPTTGSSTEFRSIGEYRYLTPKTRVRTIPLATCAGSYMILGGNGAVQVHTIGIASNIRWPIRLPPGAAILRVKIQHAIDASATETFRLTRRRPTWDTGSLTTPTESWLATVESSSDTGEHITTIEASGYVVDKYDDLSIVWVPSALSGNVIHGITIEWSDPGPTPI